MPARRPIEAVLETHSPEIMRVPGVVGIYQGARDDGSPCIRVMVAARNQSLEKALPHDLEGWPVEIEVTGEIRPMQGK